MIGKVTNLTSLIPYATFTLYNMFSYLCVALTEKLEAASKALTKERTSQQVADQALWASQESNSTLTRDLQVVRAWIDTLKEELEAAWVYSAAANQELSSKSTIFDELVVQEREAQNKLQALGDEKKTQDELLEPTRKMLSERDYSSSAMISLVVAHAVALLKSYLHDLDTELLHRDYPFDDDEEWDTLIDSVYDTPQHFCVPIWLLCSQWSGR
jgi:hypothetical protein